MIDVRAVPCPDLHLNHSHRYYLPLCYPHRSATMSVARVQAVLYRVAARIEEALKAAPKQGDARYKEFESALYHEVVSLCYVSRFT